jgi:hypothetical protein
MTGDTLLLRQINPNFLQQGQVTSQAFKPSPKDKDLLSAYDGDMISAEKAWEHFTGTLRFPSVGVMAVSVAECNLCELSARPNPDLFPEHAVIDFTGFTRNQIEKKAKQLKAAAVTRGWRYPIDNVS